MRTLSYVTDIKATPEKIWDILWNPETYSKWTHAFQPDCVMKSDWKIDGETYFLDKTEKNGMIATISSLNKPFEVVFKHLGMLENGVADRNSKAVVDWIGLQEKYFITPLDGGLVKLQMEVQTFPEYEEMMDKGFDFAIKEVKRLAEQ